MNAKVSDNLWMAQTYKDGDTNEFDAEKDFLRWILNGGKIACLWRWQRRRRHSTNIVNWIRSHRNSNMEESIVKFITSERTRTRNTYYLCSFTASRFVICMAYETCECVCVFFFPPKPNANRMENKIELYPDEMSLHVLFCLALTSSGLCRAKTLLFFGFIRGVSVAVHTSQQPRTTYQDTTIYYTQFEHANMYDKTFARATPSHHRHCVAIPRRLNLNVPGWVRTGCVRLEEEEKTASEWYFFFFFLPPPTVMPDMCRLFITRMFIFISFHHHCRWNATAALQKPIFSFVIMCRFAL